MTQGLIIREERDDDRDAASALIDAAFAPTPFSSGTEIAVVKALRRSSGVTAARVGEQDGALLGYAVVSSATVAGHP